MIFLFFLISIDSHHHIQLLLITELGQICRIQEFEAVLLLLPADTNLNSATQKPPYHCTSYTDTSWLLCRDLWVFVCLQVRKHCRLNQTCWLGRPRAVLAVCCLLSCCFVFFVCFCAFSRVSLWLRVGGWVAAVDTTWPQCSFNEGKGRRPPAFCDVSPIRTANDSRLENTAVYRHRLCQGCQYWGVTLLYWSYSK